MINNTLLEFYKFIFGLLSLLVTISLGFELSSGEYSTELLKLVIVYISLILFTYGIWKQKSFYMIPLAITSIINFCFHFFNFIQHQSVGYLGLLIGASIGVVISLGVYIQIRRHEKASIDKGTHDKNNTSKEKELEKNCLIKKTESDIERYVIDTDKYILKRYVETNDLYWSFEEESQIKINGNSIQIRCINYKYTGIRHLDLNNRSPILDGVVIKDHIEEVNKDRLDRIEKEIQDYKELTEWGELKKLEIKLFIMKNLKKEFTDLDIKKFARELFEEQKALINDFQDDIAPLLESNRVSIIINNEQIDYKHHDEEARQKIEALFDKLENEGDNFQKLINGPHTIRLIKEIIPDITDPITKLINSSINEVTNSNTEKSISSQKEISNTSNQNTYDLKSQKEASKEAALSIKNITSKSLQTQKDTFKPKTWKIYSIGIGLACLFFVGYLFYTNNPNSNSNEFKEYFMNSCDKFFTYLKNNKDKVVKEGYDTTILDQRFINDQKRYCSCLSDVYQKENKSSYSLKPDFFELLQKELSEIGKKEKAKCLQLLVNNISESRNILSLVEDNSETLQIKNDKNTKNTQEEIYSYCSNKLNLYFKTKYDRAPSAKDNFRLDNVCECFQRKLIENEINFNDISMNEKNELFESDFSLKIRIDCLNKVSS